MSQLAIFTPAPKHHYHNTVPIQGKELVKRNDNAARQEDFILGVFKANPDRDFTAWEMYNKVQELGRSIIKDSVKRSITNLMNKGFLVKTINERPGEYPKVNNRAYKLQSK